LIDNNNNIQELTKNELKLALDTLYKQFEIIKERIKANKDLKQIYEDAKKSYEIILDAYNERTN
jgi:hypothetical protein